MNEKLKELLDLIKENPELEVKFDYPYDVDGESWSGNIEEVSKSVYYMAEDRGLFCGSHCIKKYLEGETDTKNELEKQYKELKKTKEIKTAIIVTLEGSNPQGGI